MVFNCLELLGLSNTAQFWGDNINFRNLKNVSIKGVLTGVPGLESISGVWSGMNNLMTFTGYDDIIINGTNIGSGRMTSLNFEEGTDAYLKNYSASFEILQTGNLWNVTGNYYSGIYASGGFSGLLLLESGFYVNPEGGGFFSLEGDGSDEGIFGPEDYRNPKYLNSFQENFTFSNEKSGEFKYDRSFSVEIDSSYPGSISGYFYNILDRLFRLSADLQIINAAYPSYYIISGAAITYESFSTDEINKRYSANQSFTFNRTNPWTWGYTHNLNLSKEGFINVAENGEIKSTRFSGINDVTGYMYAGWSQVQAGIFGRVNSFYQYYTETGQNKVYSGSCDGLVNSPTQNSVTKNLMAGLLSYSYSYTDNPSQKTGYSYSYQDEISLNNGIISVSENGQYKGFNVNRESGFNTIYNTYVSGQNAIYERITGFYTGSLAALLDCPTARTINIEQSQETFREYFQELSYSYNFSDDPTIVNYSGFKRIEATYSNQKPVQLVGYFNIFNDSEIAQRQSQSTLGQFSNRINIIGSNTIPISSYLSAAYTRILKPSGDDVFLSEMNYSLGRANNEFNLEMVYTYPDYENINTILV